MFVVARDMFLNFRFRLTYHFLYYFRVTFLYFLHGGFVNDFFNFFDDQMIFSLYLAIYSRFTVIGNCIYSGCVCAPRFL